MQWLADVEAMKGMGRSTIDDFKLVRIISEDNKPKAVDITPARKWVLPQFLFSCWRVTDSIT